MARAQFEGIGEQELERQEKIAAEFRKSFPAMKQSPLLPQGMSFSQFIEQRSQHAAISDFFTDIVKEMNERTAAFVKIAKSPSEMLTLAFATAHLIIQDGRARFPADKMVDRMLTALSGNDIDPEMNIPAQLAEAAVNPKKEKQSQTTIAAPEMRRVSCGNYSNQIVRPGR